MTLLPALPPGSIIRSQSRQATAYNRCMPSVDELSGHATLLDALQSRAAHQPDREGFTFLLDGADRQESLTYGELNRRARAIGAQLQKLGPAAERALILCPAGLDYIVAFFGA